MIREGVMLIIFTFIVIISYFILSMPVGYIFDAFDDADTGADESNDAYDTIMPIIRTSFNMIFAILAATGVTWFIMKMFETEHDWYYRS